MKVKNLLKVFNFIDPLFLYIVALYVLSSAHKFFYQTESVWQTSWNRIQDVLGKMFLQKVQNKNLSVLIKIKVTILSTTVWFFLTCGLTDSTGALD